MTDLLRSVWQPIAAVLAALGALLIYGRRQRAAGHRDERARQAAARQDNIVERERERRNVEDHVRSGGDGTAADRLRERWSRD